MQSENGREKRIKLDRLTTKKSEHSLKKAVSSSPAADLLEEEELARDYSK